METMAIAASGSSTNKQQLDAGKTPASTENKGQKANWQGTITAAFRHTETLAAPGLERRLAGALCLHVAVKPRRNPHLPPRSRGVPSVRHGPAPIHNHPCQQSVRSLGARQDYPGHRTIGHRQEREPCAASPINSQTAPSGSIGSSPTTSPSIVDQVAPDRPLAEAISILTACGLGEPRLWLRRFADLSDGEQFRVRLAMAVSAAMEAQASARSRHSPVLIADEFCAILHRRLACAMAFNLRKLISSSGLSLIVATTHDDLQADLQPDLVLHSADRPPTCRLTSRSPARSASSGGCTSVRAASAITSFLSPCITANARASDPSTASSCCATGSAESRLGWSSTATRRYRCTCGTASPPAPTTATARPSTGTSGSSADSSSTPTSGAAGSPIISSPARCPRSPLGTSSAWPRWAPSTRSSSGPGCFGLVWPACPVAQQRASKALSAMHVDPLADGFSGPRGPAIGGPQHCRPQRSQLAPGDHGPTGLAHPRDDQPATRRRLPAACSAPSRSTTSGRPIRGKWPGCAARRGS